jgi:hypothetical protein
VSELEQTVARKDVNLAEQKRIIKRIKEENVENVRAVEAVNASLLETQYQLEAEILRLKAERPPPPASAGAVVAGARGAEYMRSAGNSGSTLATMTSGHTEGVHHSAGVDIVRHQNAPDPRARAKYVDEIIPFRYTLSIFLFIFQHLVCGWQPSVIGWQLQPRLRGQQRGHPQGLGLGPR